MCIPFNLIYSCEYSVVCSLYIINPVVSELRDDASLMWYLFVYCLSYFLSKLKPMNAFPVCASTSDEPHILCVHLIFFCTMCFEQFWTFVVCHLRAMLQYIVIRSLNVVEASWLSLSCLWESEHARAQYLYNYCVWHWYELWSRYDKLIGTFNVCSLFHSYSIGFNFSHMHIAVIFRKRRFSEFIVHDQFILTNNLRIIWGFVRSSRTCACTATGKKNLDFSMLSKRVCFYFYNDDITTQYSSKRFWCVM